MIVPLVKDSVDQFILSQTAPRAVLVLVLLLGHVVLSVLKVRSLLHVDLRRALLQDHA